MLKGAVFLAAFSASLAVSVPAMAQERGEGREAMFRAVHLSSDAPEVDVYVDDEPVGALSNVSFKTVSSYLPLPVGTHNVKVYPTGASDSLFEADVDLDGGASYTLGVVGRLEDKSLAAKLYKDDNSLPTTGNAEVRVIHAVPDLGPATVRVKGAEKDLFVLPGFSNASNYAELPAGTYDTLEVRAARTDEVALSVPNLIFSTGEVYTIFIVGRVADNSLGTVLAIDSRGSPPLLSTGGPPVPAADSATNNSLNVATPTVEVPMIHEGTVVDTTLVTLEPAYQEPVYQQPLFQEEPFTEESFAATPVEPEPDYQQLLYWEEPFAPTTVEAEPNYQQPLYWEEPFAATSIEPEPAYQWPTGELTMQGVSTTMPDTVGRATTIPNTLSESGSATAVPDAATDDVAVVQGSFSDQEPPQTSRAAHFASISGFSGQGDAYRGAGEGGTFAGVGTVASLAFSVQAPP